MSPASQEGRKPRSVDLVGGRRQASKQKILRQKIHTGNAVGEKESGGGETRRNLEITRKCVDCQKRDMKLPDWSHVSMGAFTWASHA